MQVRNRPWTDSDGDRNVDCNLLSSAAQNTAPPAATSAGRSTGANLNFGNLDPNITKVDPAILSGWGVRPYNWNYGVSVQHEVRPGLSVDVGYNRRRWGNFFVTYNQLAGPSDYDVWTVPVPINPNLPNAGGTESFVAITPAASARGSKTSDEEETSRGRRERRTGTASTSTRPRGWPVAHAADGDEHRSRRPEHLRVVGGTASVSIGGGNVANRLDACDVTEPWLTSFRGLASYRIPKVEVLVSTRVRSTRTVASENASNGSSLAANYQIPEYGRSAAARAPAGGRVGSGTRP